ncbi:MAG TPA: hypothetical protein VFQ61_15520 [Polyangiaceae bacterium]|nr:hypothetical protein [Polyangiaceae bacterium]
MQIRSFYGWLVFAALAAGCAADAGDPQPDAVSPGSVPADQAASSEPDSDAAHSDSQTLCIGFPEVATWYRYSGGGPYRIDVHYGGGDCDLHATVWEKQLDGSLYLRGDFAAHWQLLADGTHWAVVDPVNVGGYVEHLWLDAATDSTSVRVWIYYESLDSKPDAVEDTTYYRLRPPSDIFNPRRPISIGP